MSEADLLDIIKSEFKPQKGQAIFVGLGHLKEIYEKHGKEALKGYLEFYTISTTKEGYDFIKSVL